MGFIRKNVSRPERRLTTLVTAFVGHRRNWSQFMVRYCAFSEPVYFIPARSCRPGGRLEVAPITPGVRDIGAVAIGDRRTPRLRDIVNVRQHARTVQRQVDAIVRIPVVVDGKAVGPGELLEVVRRVPAVANPAFGGRLSFRLASESQRFFQQFEHCTVFGPV